MPGKSTRLTILANALFMKPTSSNIKRHLLDVHRDQAEVSMTSFVSMFEVLFEFRKAKYVLFRIDMVIDR